MPEPHETSGLEVMHAGRATVVVLGPRFESIYENDLQGFTDDLLLLGEESEPPNIVLALPHTSYIGSAFLGLLTRLSSRLRARGGVLAVCHLTPFVASAISMTQLDKVFAVHDTREDAISAIDNSTGAADHG